MAEEEKVIVTPKEEFKGKTSQGILFTILVIINTVLIGTIGYFQYLGFTKEKKQESIRELVNAEFAKRGVIIEGEKVSLDKTAEEGKLFPLDRFLVNLAPSEGVKKYLRMSIVLKFSKDANEKEFKTRRAQMIDAVISILNTKKAEDLLNKEGKDYLKHEIKASINSFLSEGRLLDLYYVSFQIN
jgi:flagellar FliL protein